MNANYFIRMGIIVYYNIFSLIAEQETSATNLFKLSANLNPPDLGKTFLFSNTCPLYLTMRCVCSDHSVDFDDVLRVEQFLVVLPDEEVDAFWVDELNDGRVGPAAHVDGAHIPASGRH